MEFQTQRDRPSGEETSGAQRGALQAECRCPSGSSLRSPDTCHLLEGGAHAWLPAVQPAPSTHRGPRHHHWLWSESHAQTGDQSARSAVTPLCLPRGLSAFLPPGPQTCFSNYKTTTAISRHRSINIAEVVLDIISVSVFYIQGTNLSFSEPSAFSSLEWVRGTRRLLRGLPTRHALSLNVNHLLMVQTRTLA